MSYTVLLAEDDDDLRLAIKDSLEDLNLNITEASSGKSAKEILQLKSFDLIITDIQMPHLTGIELLEWYWETHNKKQKAIVITGFAHILETYNAHELGVEHFLTKPFEISELKEKIYTALDIKEDEDNDSEYEQVKYCKVSIDEFVARPEIDFDVYIKLSDNKYIKIGFAGDSIPLDRINSYKDKGIKFLHISTDDFGKLLNFNMELAKIIQNKPDVDQAKKMNFMKYTGEVILEKAFISGVDKESFNEAKDYLNTSISILTDSKERLDLLEILNSHSDYIYAHSLGVAMYSIMMARKMGHTNSATFFKLSMAGIYHDIGKKEIPLEILEKPRALLDAKERALIESHSTRSYEILNEISNIPNDVIQIAYEHHEDILGHGFPRGKTKRELHPLSLIFITANIFVQKALKSANHPGMTGKDAIAEVERLNGDRLEPNSIQALKDIFNSKEKYLQVLFKKEGLECQTN